MNGEIEMLNEEIKSLNGEIKTINGKIKTLDEGMEEIKFRLNDIEEIVKKLEIKYNSDKDDKENIVISFLREKTETGRGCGMILSDELHQKIREYAEKDGQYIGVTEIRDIIYRHRDYRCWKYEDFWRFESDYVKDGTESRLYYVGIKFKTKEDIE